MRIPRYWVKDGKEDQIFHVMSRVVDKRQVFDENEKALFYRIMRQIEGFSGCEVLTYCLMGNHFHILLRVPKKPEYIGQSEIIPRLAWIYPSDKVKAIASLLDQHLEDGNKDKYDEMMESFIKRMYDLSEFVKALKQRFTQAYNRQHDRKGTLWEERFKSLLIDPKQRSLLVVAKYIDRNPLRAGLVQNAHDYRFCGLGEALRGESRARHGIAFIMRATSGENSTEEDWNRSIDSYEKIVGNLTRQDESTGTETDPFDLGDQERISSKSNPLFTNGIVLGAVGFIEDCIQKKWSRAGVKDFRKNFLRSNFGQLGQSSGLFSLRKQKKRKTNISEAT